MIKKTTMKQFVSMMQAYRGKVMQAAKFALVESAQLGEGESKQKVTQLFKGRNGYVLTGNLLNSIYSRFEERGDNFSAFLGSSCIYAKSHELGLTIRQKKAKFLWVRTHATLAKGATFRRLEPKVFYHAAKVYGSPFYYHNLVAKVSMGMGKEPLRLFLLRKQVKMVERPFLKPGVQLALGHFGQAFELWLEKVKANEGSSK